MFLTEKACPLQRRQYLKGKEENGHFPLLPPKAHAWAITFSSEYSLIF